MSKCASNKIIISSLVANLAIFMHHANLANLFQSYATNADYIIMNFFSGLALPAMSYFFFITGYLYFRKYELRKTISKWKNRFFSLCVPYIIWNTLAAFENFFDPDGKDMLSNGIIYFIKDTYWFFAKQVESGGGCANGPLWYIFRIIGFAVLTPVIFFAIKKWIGIIIILFIVGLNIIFGVGYYDFSYYLPIYLLGAYLSYNYSDEFERFIAEKKNSSVLFGSSILIIISYSIIANYFINNQISELIVRYLAILPCIIFMKFLCLPKIVKDTRGQGMFIYCSHIILFKALRTIMLRCTKNLMIVYVLQILFSIVLILFVYEFMKRKMPRILSICIGGR